MRLLDGEGDDDVDAISAQLNAELAKFRVAAARRTLEDYLVSPHQVFPQWDWAERLEPARAPRFWSVAKLPNGVRLLFAEENQLRRDQWIVLLPGRDDVDGDDLWYLTLEDAFYQSGFWNGELPLNYEVS